MIGVASATILLINVQRQANEDRRDEPAENAAIAATCRKKAVAPVHERCKCRGNPLGLLAMNPLPLLARNPFIV